MATYKISYLLDDSFSNPGEIYVDNVYDEYDAIEIATYKYGLRTDAKILGVDFICE